MKVTSRDHLEIEQERLAKLGQKVRRRLNGNKSAQRIATDGAEMWAVGKFLDPVECGRLMLMIDQVAQPSKTYDFDYAAGFRTSFSGDLNPLDPFVRQVQARFDELLGIEPAFGETIQGQRYTSGQEFKTHTDWFHRDSASWNIMGQRGGQRAFTAMVYLNDVPRGGETDFPLLDIAVKPKQGVALVWNNMDRNGVPNTRTAHAGNPVPEGVKYVITRWYRAQPWT